MFCILLAIYGAFYVFVFRQSMLSTAAVSTPFPHDLKADKFRKVFFSLLDIYAAFYFLLSSCCCVYAF